MTTLEAARALAEAAEAMKHRHGRGCQLNPGGPIMAKLGRPDPSPCSCGVDEFHVALAAFREADKAIPHATLGTTAVASGGRLEELYPSQDGPAAPERTKYPTYCRICASLLTGHELFDPTVCAGCWNKRVMPAAPESRAEQAERERDEWKQEYLDEKEFQGSRADKMERERDEAVALLRRLCEGEGTWEEAEAFLRGKEPKP